MEVNQKYRIYRTATGTRLQSQNGTVRNPNPMPTPCGTDRCYGPATIKWNSQLQACAGAMRIGVIDTSFDSTHPTFHARSIEIQSLKAAGKINGPDWHGTGILAILAGDSGSDTPGLLPEAKYFVADIFYADADGQPATDTASLLDALNWLEKKKVSIVNLSLAGPPDDFLKEAIDGLSKKNMIFVAAAGNDGPAAPPSYPAAYEQVIAVTAVSYDLKGYRHASRGDHIDFAAPGVDIWTAVPGGSAGYHSGTSFAVPYVTAIIASMFNQLPKKTKLDFLKLSNSVDLGPAGRDPIYGRGLLLAPASCRASPQMISVKAPVAQMD